MSCLTHFCQYLLHRKAGKTTYSPNSNTSQMVKFKSKKSFSKPDLSKPAWLKEWTISKGWVHNRSHMLSLKAAQEEQPKCSKMAGDEDTWSPAEDHSDGSSVSNVEDLISIISNLDNPQNDLVEEQQTTKIMPGIASKSTKNALHQNSDEDIGQAFQQISENYREKFRKNTPNRVSKKYRDLELPTIYKERLLDQQNQVNIFQNLWKGLKHLNITNSKPTKFNCKFTVNQLYDETGSDKKFLDKRPTYMNPLVAKAVSNLPAPTPKTHLHRPSGKTSLGKNIAIFNTLNAKSNIHEDAILECSDESNVNSLNYVYYNPVYASSDSKPKDLTESNRFKPEEKFEVVGRKFPPAKSQHQFLMPYKREEALKHKTKNDKYVIRHVRVRIMLSLRIGKKVKSGGSVRKKIGSERHSVNTKFSTEVEEMRHTIRRIHEEQRRIGNGTTSIKIQNMR